MKVNVLILFVIFSAIAFSQNWNLVDSTKICFYQHNDSTHITNTIVIDSTQNNSGYINYFTGFAFKYCDTCSGFSYQQPIIYRYAKEFLGFYIKNDVTNNQYYLDNNLIKHLSQTGDTWAFNVNLSATTVNVSEQTILGVLDSIKTIVLSNNDTIIISKNYGVIRYPDFENTGKYYQLVGYHQGQNSYGEYLPNFWRTYDFNVGDVFCYRLERDIWNYERTYFHKYIVLSKEVLMDTIHYKFKILGTSMIVRVGGYPPFIWIPTEPINVIKDIYFVNNNNLLENSFGIENEIINYQTNDTNFLYHNFFSNYNNNYTHLATNYFSDSNFGLSCKKTGYTILSDSLLVSTMNQNKYGVYSLNFGKVYHIDFDGFETSNVDVLIGTIKNGDTIGTIYDYTDDLGINELSKQPLKFYPNPATNQITVYGNLKNIQIYNQMGQIVLLENQPNQTINISTLSAGFYFIKAIDKNNTLYSAKLIVR